MADEKLTDLTEITSLAPDDWVYVVDKSDTTDDASGSSFKIQAKNLGGRVLLQEIDNTSTAGEFDFNSFSSAFNRLIIAGYVRGDVTGTNQALRFYFNAETTDADYHRQMVSAVNGAALANEGSDSYIGNAPGATSPSGSHAYLELVIENYNDSTMLKYARATYGAYRDADEIRMGTMVVYSPVTSAVTRVRVQADTDPTDALFGVLRLYGEM